MKRPDPFSSNPIRKQTDLMSTYQQLFGNGTSPQRHLSPPAIPLDLLERAQKNGKARVTKIQTGGSGPIGELRLPKKMYQCQGHVRGLLLHVGASGIFTDWGQGYDCGHQTSTVSIPRKYGGGIHHVGHNRMGQVRFSLTEAAKKVKLTLAMPFTHRARSYILHQ